MPCHCGWLCKPHADEGRFTVGCYSETFSHGRKSGSCPGPSGREEIAASTESRAAQGLHRLLLQARLLLAEQAPTGFMAGGGGDFCHLPCCCPGAWAEGSVVGKPSAVLGLSAAGRTEGYGQQGRGTRECVPVVMLQQRGVATESPLCRKELAWLYGKSRKHKPLVFLQKITIIGAFPKTGIPSHSSGIRGAGKGPWWPFCQNFLPQRV